MRASAHERADTPVTMSVCDRRFTARASYAVIKVGVLAIDLRLDVAAGPSTAFGTAGVGINVN